jgi:hypothetical protein
MLQKILIGAAVLFGILWGASAVTKGLGPGPRVVFEALLDRESARVGDFDGFVSQRNGYDSHLRFRATEDWVAAIPYLGFREAACDAVRSHVHFSVMRLAAWPPWRPEELENVRCYERLGANKWSVRGRDYVLAEAGGGWVYFSGKGPKRDKALPE